MLDGFRAHDFTFEVLGVVHQYFTQRCSALQFFFSHLYSSERQRYSVLHAYRIFKVAIDVSRVPVGLWLSLERVEEERLIQFRKSTAKPDTPRFEVDSA